ncbi:COBW domain-containing protein 1, partial [Coemansia aciculifera]
DLLDDESLNEIEGVIRAINGTALVERTSFAKIDLNAILNIGAYADVGPETPQPFAESLYSHHHIDARIRTMALNAPHRLFWSLVDEWIQELLWDSRVPGSDASSDMEILRLKALLLTTDFVPVGSDDEPFGAATVVVQGVREMYDSFIVPDKEGDDDNSVELKGLYKLVLIGREMPEQALRHSWAQLMERGKSE